MRLLIAKKKGPDSKQYRDELLHAPVSFMYNEPPGLKEWRVKDKARREQEEKQHQIEETMKNLPKDQRRAMERELEENMSVHERNTRRFAFLKNAPLKDEWCKNVEVNHKPFGVQVNNTKCFKCGGWGHRIGDLTCPATNDPTRSWLNSVDNKGRDPTKDWTLSETEREK